MLRARTIYVLGELASADPTRLREARRASYDAIDPLVRGWVRRRVARALAHAGFETTRPEDESHVHRLAYLRAVGRAAPNPDDVDAVRDDFEQAHRGRRAPRALRWGARASAAVALGVLVVGWSAHARWAPRPYAGLEVRATPVEGAYLHGGRPSEGSAALRKLMREGVPRFVVELGRRREAMDGQAPEVAAREVARMEERARELDEDAREAMGVDAASFLAGILREAIAITRAGPDQGPGADSFIRSIDAFDAEMASRNLGYYVDGEVLRSSAGALSVVLFTFQTELVRIYESDGRTVRALRLRRLDTLNVQRPALGFTRPNIRDALVLMEPLESWLAGTIAPMLADRDTADMIDPPTRLGAAPWVSAVQERARRDIREAMAGLAVPTTSLHAVSLDLARRDELLEKWRQELSAAGMRLSTSNAYRLDLGQLAGVRDSVDSGEWEELEGVVERLGEQDRVAAFRAMEEVLVESVERHEVQHRLDFERGTASRLPPALELRVGPLEYFGRDNRLAQRALTELSAYLSEVARGGRLSKLNLAFLGRFLFNRGNWGTPESYAALLVFEGLGRSFGLLGADEDLIVARAVNRERLAEVYLGVTDHPATETSDAASALWAELMGRPLDPLRLRVRSAR